LANPLSAHSDPEAESLPRTRGIRARGAVPGIRSPPRRTIGSAQSRKPGCYVSRGDRFDPRAASHRAIGHSRQRVAQPGRARTAEPWAGRVVHRSARPRLLLLAEQERAVVRGSLLVVVPSMSGRLDRSDFCFHASARLLAVGHRANTRPPRTCARSPKRSSGSKLSIHESARPQEARFPRKGRGRRRRGVAYPRRSQSRSWRRCRRCWFTPDAAVRACRRGCCSCACYSGVRGLTVEGGRQVGAADCCIAGADGQPSLCVSGWLVAFLSGSLITDVAA
jgi:hypothetical protein